MDSARPRSLFRLVGRLLGPALGCAVGCATADVAVVPLAAPLPAAEARPHDARHDGPRDAEAAPEPVPVGLDAVLRLAEQGNPQLAVAREKINEAQADLDLAGRSWLPHVTAGVGYLRHEGGIVNEDGTLQHSSFGALFPGVEIKTAFDLREATFGRVDSQRKMWQARGEASRVTNEVTLEAANTYLDLLAARRGHGVAVGLQARQADLLKRAADLERDVGGAARTLAEGMRAEAALRRQALARLGQQGDAAAAKLAYLLGLGPDCQPVPVDPEPTPLDLIDATPPAAELVARALAQGPGVRELQGLVGVIGDGLASLEGPAALLPRLELCVGEGAQGAGPGGTLTFDNRLDVGVRASWDLTEWLTARERKRVAQSKLRQAQLGLDDLRGRLALGVREARDAILAGRTQVAEGATAVRHAAATYEIAEQRLKDNPATGLGEAVAALRGLEVAHLQHLSAVTAYNKAQVRLLLLLGPGAASGCP